MMGILLWVRLGLTSGCANRRIVDVEPDSCINLKASLTLLIVVTVVFPILISHMPFTRVCQSFIFAVGVLRDIVPRWRWPSLS